MKHRKELKKLLISLLGNSASHKDVNRLVHVTVAIAKTYFQSYRYSFLRLCTQHGMTQEDLAVDSISEIFKRDEQGEYPSLRNFSDSLQSSFEEADEDEVFFTYRAFVQTIAIRRLVKIYKGIDPKGANIYRAIRDSIRIKGKEKITLMRDYRGPVLATDDHSAYEYLPPFPFQELEQFFAGKVTTGTITDLLTVLMSILNGQDIFKHSLPLFDAVRLFRPYYSKRPGDEIRLSVEFDLSEISRDDLRILKHEVMRDVKQKIRSTYVVSGKISRTQEESMYRTLADIINEWFDEKSDSSTYFYHAKANLQVDKAQYEEKWRTKIEYLVRFIRAQLAKYMMDGL